MSTQFKVTIHGDEFWEIETAYGPGPSLDPHYYLTGTGTEDLVALRDALGVALGVTTVARLRTLVAPILARTEGQIGTHSDQCYEYHVGCLAAAVEAVLEGDG